ncbi:GYDIA family GHMP kinase [Winogradskyella sp.]|uniref:GYDIA family GHMP kinase n=1 Tax=Winogradskyella sp. TaxID=1883156 RepID=UPI003BAAE0B8
MPKGYVYILECNDGSYYTGSTVDIEKRINEHHDGKGANHTKKRLPVTLMYLEEFQRIDDAFNREKQIQGWSRAKKEALINNNLHKLPELSLAYRDKVASRTSATNKSRTSATRKSKTSTDMTLPEVGTEGTRSTLEDNTLKKTFRSNGKLLISGEYVVLDGAKALALPTTYGQSLSIEENSSNTITWRSHNEKGEIWFEDTFIINDGEILKSASTTCPPHKALEGVAHNTNIQIDYATADRLLQILKVAKDLNPTFLKNNQGYNITTHQDFNRKWGLGTSSTLINNLANWLEIDAYSLLQKTFGGSGYDIACAQNSTPITYQLNDPKQRLVEPVVFNPSFKNHLYFVYLNQKQNSRDGIKAYKALRSVDTSTVNTISRLTESIIASTSLSDFEHLVTEHEAIIAHLIQQIPIQSRWFSDFDGTIKSLGAWGGDFVLATSATDPTDYFTSKGFTTIIPYQEMVLN